MRGNAPRRFFLFTLYYLTPHHPALFLDDRLHLLNLG
jgi:hypothetical protein